MVPLFGTLLSPNLNTKAIESLQWSAPNLCAGCFESLVLPLTQEVPRLDVYLAADPIVGVVQPLHGLLINTEVGTS